MTDDFPSAVLVSLSSRRMRSWRTLPLLALAALSACASNDTRDTEPMASPVAAIVAAAPALPPPPPRNPQFVPTERASRVILASFDATSADELVQFGAPHFQQMPLRVTRVVPVNPTSSSSTHVAILTGATPDVSGIVANKFHALNAQPGQTTLGMEAEFSAETIVQSARKAGKRVGTIIFPTLDATSPARTADFGLTWSKPVTPARVVHLRRDDFRSDWLPPGWGGTKPSRASYSPVLRARFTWSVPQHAAEDADLVAYDTTDDHVRNYDIFFVEIGTREIALDAKHWFSISERLDDGRLYGSWSKLLSHDAGLGDVVLYLGAICRTEGYPADFLKVVEDEIGFWPGLADETSARLALDAGVGADVTTFIEQNDRFSDFVSRVNVLTITRARFDLLLTYQPIVDQAGHQFHITLPSQKYATPENVAAGELVRRASYAALDRSVAAMMSAVDPRADALVVTGDHGMASVDSEVHVNQLLADWGLASRWNAYANGNIAELYRVADPDDSATLVQRLSTLRSPDGALVFERVERRGTRAHPNAGDIAAYSYPRFALNGSTGVTFVQPFCCGNHGGLNSHPELHTTLAATGRGIPERTLDQIQQTEIARFIATLLGIPVPVNAE